MIEIAYFIHMMMVGYQPAHTLLNLGRISTYLVHKLAGYSRSLYFLIVTASVVVFPFSLVNPDIVEYRSR